MKQKLVYLQSLVQHVSKMSGCFQFHETSLVDAAMCFHHKPFVTFHQENLQNNSPFVVEVNSEAYSCSILPTFEEFCCLSLGMIC